MNRFRKRLASVKEEIEHLNQEINSSKISYSVALHKLEAISEEIHERRNAAMLRLLKREPGVGAENDQAEFNENLCLNENQINQNESQLVSKEANILSQMIQKLNVISSNHSEPHVTIPESKLHKSESLMKIEQELTKDW